MTSGVVNRQAPSRNAVKKGTKPMLAKKRAKKKAAPAGPIVLTAAQDAFLEQITQEGMARMRWSRRMRNARRASSSARPTLPRN